MKFIDACSWVARKYVPDDQPQAPYLPDPRDSPCELVPLRLSRFPGVQPPTYASSVTGPL
jgi:hypothetical protein